MRLSELLCRVGGHRPPASPVWNDQRFFGRCPRCARDLLRAEHGGWSEVPPGYRVVWKPRTPADPPRWLGASAVVWSGKGRGGVAPLAAIAPRPDPVAESAHSV